MRFLLLLLVLLLLLLRVCPLPARRCFGQHWARSRHAASARSSLQPPDVMEIACARHIIHNASSGGSGPRLDPAFSRAPNPFAISGCSGRTHAKKISDRMPENIYQIEYQLNCMTDKVQNARISCHYRLGTKMLDRMTTKMPHRMTGYVSDKASDKMSE